MAQAQIQPALAVETELPARPAESTKRAYSSAIIVSYLTLSDLIDQVVG